MSEPNRDQLITEIKAMGPWHHDIVLFDDFSTGKVFSPTGTLPPPENDGVSLISPKGKFMNQLEQLYPDGMADKTFLDCACNGGGYCFWAREYGVKSATGFDVREHWINQAKFVQQHRTSHATDNVEFYVMDLYDVPKQNFDQVDMTYFSGIFYHLPDPVTGLKIAADLTKDVIVLNTAMKIDESNPAGMTMARESRTRVMSGVHELSWFPNGSECLVRILKWLGFEDLKITMLNQKEKLLRARIEIIAAREKGRLERLSGESVA